MLGQRYIDARKQWSHSKMGLQSQFGVIPLFSIRAVSLAALKQCIRSLNIVCSHVMKFSPSPIFGPIIFCTRVCRHLISVHLLGERSDKPIYPDRRAEINNAIQYNIGGNIGNDFRLKYQAKFVTCEQVFKE